MAKLEQQITVVEMRRKALEIEVIGTTPMIQHRFSQKARQELLLPKRKANRAAREQSLKHDPALEFREGLYRTRDASSPSAIHIPGPQLRQAIAAAALDLPGDAKKTELLRWITIEGNLALFGLPRLHMSMVRSSGMTRVPDVRTRPVFPEWAFTATIAFPEGRISTESIVALLDAAGQFCGIGDWRPQKGGDFGQFTVVRTSADKAKFDRIVAEQGRAAQLVAIENPVTFDEDTEELLDWFTTEADRRDLTITEFEIGDDEEEGQ